ncbi:MAG: nitroreductase family deazaflavin-dependent oxidoreductase [Dehalococcoidia bacterium]
MATIMQKVFSGANTAVYRATKGRLGSKFGKAPVLLLTTTGRKSGSKRTVPLMYVRDGDGYAVIASNGGADVAPGWWANLKANPQGTVQVKGEKVDVTASRAPDDERERLMPALKSMYSGYEGYEKKTSRKIPIVLLKR